MKNIIEFKHICKSFGEVKALDDVSFSIREGEILSLLGENGSGKTTLMNVLNGIYYPDEGEIYVNGKLTHITSPKDASRNRIGMVHQHFKLVDIFNGVENVVLGLKNDDYRFFASEAMKSENDKFANIFSRVSLSNKGISVDKKLIKKYNFLKKIFSQFSLPFNYEEFILHFSDDDLDRFNKEFNNFLRLRKSTKGFNLKESKVRIDRLCTKYGFKVDANKKIYEMSVSEKQTIEIIKVFYRGADVLILDEPTAVLTPQETEKLFEVLKNMRDSGETVIIITHKLDEVLSLSDRVAVLRKGQFVGIIDTKDANEEILTEMMVGKKVDLNIARQDPINTKLRLELSHVTVKNKTGIKVLDDVSFEIKSGEITGIAGISGCGQKELLETIAGLQNAEKGSSIIYHQRHNKKTKQLIGMSSKKIRELGIHLSFVPEDRLGMGLVGSMGMTDNMLLKTYRGKKKEDKSIFVKKKTPETLAKTIKNQLEVVTPSINTPVRLLSGGNVQKVLVGREIANDPAVLLTAYAVRGLDINSSYLIYDLLNQQKEKGVAVVYVGEDLDVLLALCDKIIVLCNGKVNGVLDARKANKNEVGHLMTSLTKGE